MNNAQTLLSMPGVGFFGMLVIGIIAGYIAEKVTASDHGLLTNLLVGIAGSFVGGTLANLLNIEFYGWLGNLIVASIGAIIVLWIWRRFRDRTAGKLSLASMVDVIGQTDDGAAAPSGEGAAARHARPAEAALDPRQGARRA